MRSRVLITDEDGEPLGYGCGPRQPTPGDIAIVREFAEQLRVRKPCAECEGTHEVPAPGGVASCPVCCCGVCGKATDTPPECLACAADDEARAKRKADR